MQVMHFSPARTTDHRGVLSSVRGASQNLKRSVVRHFVGLLRLLGHQPMVPAGPSACLGLPLLMHMTWSTAIATLVSVLVVSRVLKPVHALKVCRDAANPDPYVAIDRPPTSWACAFPCLSYRPTRDLVEPRSVGEQQIRPSGK